VHAIGGDRGDVVVEQRVWREHRARHVAALRIDAHG